MQALIERLEDAPSLDVEQEPPPEGKEYVNSLMYWFVARDHALIITSRALGTGQLERYLSWLLNEKTQVIESTGHVILKAEFDATDIGGDLEDIREIIIGYAAPVLPTAADRALVSDKYHKLTSRSSWSERAVGVLLSVMSSEADVRRLLRSVPPEAELRVSVHIGYLDRRRQVTTEPMQRAFRNLPEGEIVAKGRHGRLTGQDIRLSYPTTIEKNGSLLKHAEVLRAFEEAYNYFRDHGKLRT